MGGVCVRTHKTFACVRVSMPRLCAFSSARWFHTWHSAFFCQTRLLLFCCCFVLFFGRGNTHDSIRKKCRKKKKPETPREQSVSVRAEQESHCKVSALSHTSLLCAATFVLLQLLLRFVCAWSFGIFDIFRISRCRFADSEPRVFSRELLFYVPTHSGCMWNDFLGVSRT